MAALPCTLHSVKEYGPTLKVIGQTPESRAAFMRRIKVEALIL